MGRRIYNALVRTRVKPSWRTRVLFLIALVLSGVIAWNEVREREARAARRPQQPPAPANVIEVELAE